MSMIWHRPRSDRWISACGRYSATKARIITDRLLVCVYFYGFLVLRERHDVVGDDLPNSTRRWCEEHRMRALPRVCEFEAWASEHYRCDVAKQACGPLAKRDLIRRLMEERGDADVELPWSGGRPMTIGQRFAAIYMSIDPEAAERTGAKDSE